MDGFSGTALRPVVAGRGSLRPSRQEAEEAVRTLIRWIGDNPAREGLAETPARVVKAYDEWFGGYGEDPASLLSRTFEDVGSYDEPVMLRDIPFRSTCEHHMAPIVGVAHVAYLPRDRVVGISKIARVVDALARRLQIQERLTAEIAEAIDRALDPHGVAVQVEASHACISSRGVNKEGITMVTSKRLGIYKDDPRAASQFLDAVRLGGRQADGIERVLR